MTSKIKLYIPNVPFRSICDYFFDAQNAASSPTEIPPVIATPHHFLISIFRNNIFLVAVTTTEVKVTIIILIKKSFISSSK